MEEDEIKDNEIEKGEESWFEPECTASEEEKEKSGIECEFEVRDGSWWCTTHNCWA